VTEETKNPHGERWATIATAIRERRSNLNVDPERPVPREVIDDLIALAVTAPNHYRTNPWRFVVLTGAARGSRGPRKASSSASGPSSCGRRR
jgi:nitroreductase